VSTFEAEAAMRFEAVADPTCREAYGVRESAQRDETANTDTTPGPIFRSHTLLRELVADMQGGVPVPTISARFHNGVCWEILRCVQLLREQRGLSIVALSGGVFQNRWLLEGTTELLEEAGFTVLTHSTVPPNDGGIAYGQLAIAAARRERNVLGSSR
jgi:hydrogenase maturation protein HypF